MANWTQILENNSCMGLSSKGLILLCWGTKVNA